MRNQTVSDDGETRTEVYHYFKALEGAASNVCFLLPHEGSDHYQAMVGKLMPWEYGALAHLLGRFQKAASEAATAEYMRGKE